MVSWNSDTHRIEPRYNFHLTGIIMTWTPDIHLIHRLGHDIKRSWTVFDGGLLRYPPYPDWNEIKVCFAEIRKRDGSVINVNMGCKQAKACETNHEMNFRDPNPWQQQVSHKYESSSRVKNPIQCQFSNKKFGSNSVCRQCCYVDNCFNAYGLEGNIFDIETTWRVFNSGQRRKVIFIFSSRWNNSLGSIW